MGFVQTLGSCLPLKFLITRHLKDILPGVVAPIFNANTQEIEAEDCEFKASLGCYQLTGNQALFARAWLTSVLSHHWPISGHLRK